MAVRFARDFAPPSWLLSLCLLASLKLVCPAQTFTILHSFGGGSWEPTQLTLGPDGSLYGANGFGGPGVGYIYKISPGRVYFVLHNFSGGTDGGTPSQPILDPSGNLYGVTFNGGSTDSGIIYKIDTRGHFEVLYNFLGGVTGANPQTALVRDLAGNLYGATPNGGSSNCGRGPLGCGIIFKFDTSGQFSVLYTFQGAPSDGLFTTYGALVLDQSGNLYGVTNAGGSYNDGTVYKITPAGVETILLSFDPAISGGEPTSGLLQTPAGELYGTGRSFGSLGGGVVFALSETGTLRVVYSFSEIGPSTLASGVVADSAGNLFGTTEQGGTFGNGTIYKITKDGTSTTLYSFTGGTDGGFPGTTLVIDKAGNLYGTSVTSASGSVVFKFTP